MQCAEKGQQFVIMEAGTMERTSRDVTKMVARGSHLEYSDIG